MRILSLALCASILLVGCSTTESTDDSATPAADTTAAAGADTVTVPPAPRPYTSADDTTFVRLLTERTTWPIHLWTGDRDERLVPGQWVRCPDGGNRYRASADSLSSIFLVTMRCTRRHHEGIVEQWVAAGRPQSPNAWRTFATAHHIIVPPDSLWR